MSKIYLASPFFTEKEREVKARVKEHLLSQNHDVHDPQNPCGERSDGWEINNSEWGCGVFLKDTEAIDNCDLVVAIDWGLYSDTGTAWEIGYAWAKEKRVLIVVPNEALNIPHSLMVANGSDNFISLSRFLQSNVAGIIFHSSSEQPPFFLYGVEQK